MKTWFITPLSALGLILAQSAVGAQSLNCNRITGICNPDPSITSIPIINTDIQSFLSTPSIPKFIPPALTPDDIVAGITGFTLTGAQVTYTATVTPPNVFTNTGSVPVTGTYSIPDPRVWVEAVGISLPPTASDDTPLDVSPAQFGFGPITVPVPEVLPGETTPTLTVTPVTRTITLSPTNPPDDLSAFVGTGTGDIPTDFFSFEVSTLMGFEFDGGSNLIQGVPTFFEFTADVQYSFVPIRESSGVPEPSTVLALGALGLGAGALGKKRKL